VVELTSKAINMINLEKLRAAWIVKLETPDSENDSVLKLISWFDEQFIYQENNQLDIYSTRDNFLVVHENYSINVKGLATEASIARSVFYNNAEIEDHLKELRKALNKDFPSLFHGVKRKKKNNPSKSLMVNEEKLPIHDQSVSQYRDAMFFNNALEKQLTEEKAKNEILEKSLADCQQELDAEQKQNKRFNPSIKALIELGVFPQPLVEHKD
jgi:acyl carrier protein phosphodiesterase